MAPCVLCANPARYCLGHSDEWDVVAEIICENEDEIRERVVEIIHSGAAKWQWDPEVPNVAGLIKHGTNYAFMVVYVKDRDFEVSLDFFGDE